MQQNFQYVANDHCCLWPVFCCSKPEQPNEKVNWILAATSIAPVVCFGSHYGFVVLAWLADPKHAGTVSVIYTFSCFSIISIIINSW